MSKHCMENMTLMTFKNDKRIICCDHMLCEKCGHKVIMPPMPRQEWYESLDDVIIYTDGSVSGNGKPDAIGGWATILQAYRIGKGMIAEVEKCGKLVYDTDNCPVTNNRAEMYGILRALESITKPCKVKVYSDSEWCVKTINGEYHKKTNLDLWDRLDAVIQELERIGCWVVVSWVKGHADDELNKRVDKMASKVKREGEKSK